MKRSLMGTPVAAEPGQLFRAEAHRGCRYVRVLSVRGLKSYFPYALCREVLPSGKWTSGESRLGLKRGSVISVQLIKVNGALTLSSYEPVEVTP